MNTHYTASFFRYVIVRPIIVGAAIVLALAACNGKDFDSQLNEVVESVPGNASSSSSGEGSTFGVLPPVEGKIVSAPVKPLAVPSGSVEICKSGDNWVSLVSKNFIGCKKACQSQGMNCRRSYHDSASGCGYQPWEIGCGQLSKHSTDFCACSSETFFQGELYDEHPKTRPAPPIETCQVGEGWATLVFSDYSGCEAACASVGLQCHKSFEDLELECGPQADPDFELACDNNLEHKSDFCACTVDGTAGGLPGSVLNPWRPY